MKHLLIVAVMALMIFSCSSQQVNRTRVIVREEPGDKPLAHATIIVKGVTQDNTIFTDSVSTDLHGEAIVKVKSENRISYSVMAFKEGYWTLSDTAGGNGPGLYDGGPTEVTIRLTRDSAVLMDMWAQIVPSIPPLRLVEMIRRDAYPYHFLPLLLRQDIGILLEHAADTTSVRQFPVNMLSSWLPDETTRAELLLWMAESWRKNPGRVAPAERYPSLVPVLVIAGNNGDVVPGEDIIKAVRAYRAWWKEYQDEPQLARLVDPLEGTGLRWR